MNLETVTRIVELTIHLITVIGGLWAIHKWRVGQKTTRARYLKVLLGEYNHGQIQDFCVAMEIGKDIDTYFDGSDLKKAREVRRTLRFFSYLCHALDAKLITEIEFDMFKDEMCAILSDSRVQAIVLSGLKGGADLHSPYAPLKEFMENSSGRSMKD